MLIVKIGGPAYRIGMGGGAASSVPSGSNRADLDFNAVQVNTQTEEDMSQTCYLNLHALLYSEWLLGCWPQLNLLTLLFKSSGFLL